MPGIKNVNIADHSHRYKDTQGSFYSNAGATLNGQPVYAAAYMIQSSPSMICPYFNDTISYRSSTGLAYYVVCGGQYNNGIDITGGGSTTSKFPERTPRRYYCILKSSLTQDRSRSMHCSVVSLSIPRSPRVLPLTTVLQRAKHFELYRSCMVIPQWI